MNKMSNFEATAATSKATAVGAQVEALLARMSLAEKIGQLNQVGGADFIPGPKAEDQIRAGPVPCFG